MKRISLLLMLAVLLPGAQAQSRRSRSASRPAPAVQRPSETLPIRRVVLYSNGVAYFERRGTVSGRAEINLSFKQSQIDDVLKSMVVLDMGRGRIGAVSYNSSAPPSARLNEIPFAIESGTDGDSTGGLAGVLEQLQGARVVVTTSNRTATGSILTVEERKVQGDENKTPRIQRALVIAAESGEIASFDLAEVRSVRLLDEGARKDLNEFASATASARRRDAKTIVVTSDGEGQREMVISYTVAAPIWKTTYRVVLDSNGKPFFQGWAIVDNIGEEDWTDVQLSLVSGTPVSFIQPIQQPLFRYRPVMPIPDDLNTDPQTYGNGQSSSAGGSSMSFGGGSESGMGSGSGAGSGPAGSGASGIQQSNMQQGGINSRNFANNISGFSSGVTAPTTTLSDVIMSEESGVKTAATGSEIGDLFEYRIDQPVTVRRDRSALIPILQTRLDGERVSVYNEATRRDRPMRGLRLKNTSPLTLESGTLTVIDGDAYAGEALIERFKPGEQKFIPFAVDLATLVSSKQTGDRRPTFLVRAVNGVFQAHYHRAEKKTYTVVNQTDKPRIVYIEHPIREGWMLSDDTPKPVSKTSSVYRFRLDLAPNASTELTVSEHQALMDSYEISDLTRLDVNLFVTRRYIDEAMRAELDKIIEIKGRIAAVLSRLEEVEKETEEIGEDQERLRDNIKALGEKTEARGLIARYVAKAGEQETRLEQLTAERKKLTAEHGQIRRDLAAAIRALSFDRRIAD
jgi:hypothetical protein